MRKNIYFMEGKDFINKEDNILILTSHDDTFIHKHDFIEIVYFYSSQGVHVVNNEKFYIHNGSLCILNAGIEHYYQIPPTENEEITVRNIIFYPALFGEKFTAKNFINEMYEELMGMPPIHSLAFIQIPNDYNKEFFKLLTIMQTELLKKDWRYLDVVRSCLKTILYKIFRDKSTSKKPSPIMLNNIKLIETAIHFLDEHYNENISLASISKQYNFSNVYFNQLFKEYTGQTFKKYLQKLRIEKAKDLLQTSDETLDSICQKVGYADLKQFHLLFKREVGFTPFQYKKNIRFIATKNTSASKKAPSTHD